jgi:thiamine pyrophosphokinase
MPTIVLGDFDSISASELQDARAAHVPLVEYPSDKDVTDAEIALQYIVDEKCESLLLISGGGDRLDHLLSLLHALCNESLEGLRRCAVIGDTRIDIVTPVWPLDLSVDFGQLVSLVPLTQDAIGVSATGLRWVLQHDTLRVAESRGVSNVTNEGRITVSVENGCIAVMQPHYFPQHKEPAS